jgi:hypothetical protein
MLSGDASWKCKAAPVSAEWMTVTFDDSTWSNPVTLYGNGLGPWAIAPPIANISLQAKWIWTSSWDFAGHCVLQTSSLLNITVAIRRLLKSNITLLNDGRQLVVAKEYWSNVEPILDMLGI